jgi:hypothetical protein
MLLNETVNKNRLFSGLLTGTVTEAMFGPRPS